MSDITVLIDTNIIIHLEDNKEVQEGYSELLRLCQKHKISVFIHEDSFKDIQNDKDIQRKKITLSKLQKYLTLKATIIPESKVISLFGPNKNNNDVIDSSLLYSLYIGAVSIFVTEDKGLIKRARNSDKPLTVFTVSEALDFIGILKEPAIVKYPYIEKSYCYQLDPRAAFFDSLRVDYPGFDEWFESCIQKHRECWIIKEENNLAGLLIYKDEQQKDIQDEELDVPGNKIFKICCFKISENFRGEKYGEQLLKQVMDYCFKNNYDSIYFHTYPEHETLLLLVEKFGFQHGKNKGNEVILYKVCRFTTASIPTEYSDFEFHKHFWPSIKISENTQFHMIPIRPEYHSRLYPEYQISEFGGQQLKLSVDKNIQNKTPGNAIRKVYISKNKYTKLKRGDVILFYRSQDKILTTVGIVERVDFVSLLNDLVSLTGRKTVYAELELRSILKECPKPLVINFYFSFHLIQAIEYIHLRDHQILCGPPQSLLELNRSKFNSFFELLPNVQKDYFINV